MLPIIRFRSLAGKPNFLLTPVNVFQRRLQFSTTQTPIDGEEIDEPDVLLKKIELEVKGHDPAVLKSYQTFLEQVCGHFELHCDITTRHSPILDRLSLNKSPFIHKKHQRQYEFRTYVKTFTIPRLTGCTANVFLEYVQRNLPAGVHMAVKQHRVEPLPDAIQNSMKPNREDSKPQ